VIVWLGREIPEVEAVLWLSDHYVEAVGSNVPHSMMVSHFKLTLREWAGLWGAHSEFYRRYRWFRRAWVSSIPTAIVSLSYWD
jgi:hypothetical protein